MSIVTLSGVPVAPSLSAASVNLPASMVTEPWPSKPSSAVKVAVVILVSSIGQAAQTVPLTTEMSAGVNPTRASEKVNVTFELLSLSLRSVSAMSIARSDWWCRS